jgi:hypothetical protein
MPSTGPRALDGQMGAMGGGNGLQFGDNVDTDEIKYYK